MIFLVDKKNRPLNMLHPAQGRKFLTAGKASVISNYPFILKLKHEVKEPLLNEYTIKLDPGAKTTGISILQDNKIMFCAELEHRVFNIVDALKDRAMHRRFRRARHTRYRKARFLNRGGNKEGWIPPSFRSRINNIVHWVKKLMAICPITNIVIEHCKFDTQLMDNPEIKGVEYQQGTLLGYEVRQYLLEKFNYKCAYCGNSNTALQIEHIQPKAKGGSNRLSNLTIACEKCNIRKGKMTLQEFGKKAKKDFSAIQKQAEKTIKLKDTAIMNSSRWKTFEELNTLAPVTCGTGGRTKFNRTINNLPKTHYFDAACVGSETPEKLDVKAEKVLYIKAVGRGKHKRTNVDKYGFPRQKLPRQKNFFGFLNKSIIEAFKDGKKIKGLIASCRNSGSFTIKSFSGERLTVNHKNLKLIQRANGYEYKIDKILTK